MSALTGSPFCAWRAISPCAASSTPRRLSSPVNSSVTAAFLWRSQRALGGEHQDDEGRADRVEHGLQDEQRDPSGREHHGAAVGRQQARQRDREQEHRAVQHRNQDGGPAPPQGLAALAPELGRGHERVARHDHGAEHDARRRPLRKIREGAGAEPQPPRPRSARSPAPDGRETPAPHSTSCRRRRTEAHWLSRSAAAGRSALRGSRRRPRARRSDRPRPTRPARERGASPRRTAAAGRAGRSRRWPPRTGWSRPGRSVRSRRVPARRVFLRAFVTRGA